MSKINQIKREIEKDINSIKEVLDKDEVDEMMKTGREISPKYPMLDIVNAEATKYIEELMRKLSEYKVDLVFSKGVFVGGGSERFKEWIERSDYVLEPYFVLNVHANAQGYESLIKFQRETAKNS